MSTTVLAADDKSEIPAAVIRGRWAIVAVFFLNGLTLSTYIVRMPSLKAVHHLTDGQVGLTGTVFGAAALVAMQFVGSLVSRFGSARIIRLTLPTLPVVLVALGLAPSVVTFFGAVLLLGAVHGTLDTSMNAHGVAVERLRRRSVLSGCHAGWSISAVVASLLASALIASGVSLVADIVGVGVFVFIGALVVSPLLLPASIDRTDAGTATPRPGGWRLGWTRAVVVLGLTGTVLMFCDAAALAWSGIFLHDDRGATLAVASIAVTAYTGCQTAGRLLGDRLKMRYGTVPLFRAGGLIGVAGFLLAVVAHAPALVIVGFAILGSGTCLLIPLTFSAVGHAGGTGPGAASAVARFSTFTYSGILLGPAMIGWIAEGVGLAWTLAGLIPLLALVVTTVRLPGPAGTGTEAAVAAP